MELLFIVGQNQPMNPMYRPSTLVWDPVAKIWLTKVTYEAWYRLKKQMQEEGLAAPKITDGYRSYAYQKKLYEDYLCYIHRKRYTTRLQYKRRVALPGCSEHQLGTTLDCCLLTEEQRVWFDQYAKDFGFVLTDASHNHYRYVGVRHARKMQKTGLCLEEYSELYKQYKSL